MTPELSPGQPGPVQQLVRAAQELMEDALHAYVNDRPLKVAATAPVAVEHLAKALLWEINPALLVMLDRNHEESLRLLTSGTPSLDHPRLRTIGLGSALKRLPEEITQTVSSEKRQEMINARNGAVHAGQAQDAIQIMTTALNIADNLLRALDIGTSNFHLSHTETVANLLTEGRSLVQQRVDKEKARARIRFGQIEHLSHDHPTEMSERGLRPNLHGYDVTGVIAALCPICDFNGSLEGHLDVDYEIDAQWSDGEQVTSVWPYWEFSAFHFTCHVCNLRLHGADELLAADEAGIETEYQVTVSGGKVGTVGDHGSVTM